MRGVVVRLGDSWEPTGTYDASFAPGRADGASAVRNFAYDSRCPCFRYTSAPYRVA